MIEPNVLEQRLKAAFPGAERIEVQDLTGTKDHYKAVIVAREFVGKTRIEQHQLVYRALGELMAGPVHALALETRVPSAP
jgi:stress-induced morphogen